MLRSFFSSRTRVKLLQLFINNPHRQFYLREISKLFGEPLTPIRRELLNLMHIGFLTRTKVANLIYYEVNSDFLLYQEFKQIIEKTDFENIKKLKNRAKAEHLDLKVKKENSEYQDENVA